PFSPSPPLPPAPGPLASERAGRRRNRVRSACSLLLGRRQFDAEFLQRLADLRLDLLERLDTADPPAAPDDGAVLGDYPGGVDTVVDFLLRGVAGVEAEADPLGQQAVDADPEGRLLALDVFNQRVEAVAALDGQHFNALVLHG